MNRRLLIAASLIALLLLVGCGAKGASAPGEGAGTIVQEAKTNATGVTCRTNRAQIDQAYSNAQSTSAEPVVFATVLQQANAKCPGGGTYSWDTATSKTRCSIHGE